MMVLGRNFALTAVLGLLLTGDALAKLKGERELPQQHELSPHQFGKELHRALGYEECCVWKCEPPPPPPPPPYNPYPPMGPKDKGPKDKGPKDKGPKHMGPKDKGYGYHRALAPSPNQRQLQWGGYYGYNPYQPQTYGYSPYYQQPGCYWDCSACEPDDDYDYYYDDYPSSKGMSMMGSSKGMSMMGSSKGMSMMGSSKGMSMMGGGKMGGSKGMSMMGKGKGSKGSYPSDDYTPPYDDDDDDGPCCEKWLVHCEESSGDKGMKMGKDKHGKEEICKPYCAVPCSDDHYYDDYYYDDYYGHCTEVPTVDHSGCGCQCTCCFDDAPTPHYPPAPSPHYPAPSRPHYPKDKGSDKGGKDKKDKHSGKDKKDKHGYRRLESYPEPSLPKCECTCDDCAPTYPKPTPHPPSYPTPTPPSYPSPKAPSPKYPKGPGGHPKTPKYPKGPGGNPKTPKYPKGPGGPPKTPKAPHYPKGPGGSAPKAPKGPKGPSGHPKGPKGPGGHPKGPKDLKDRKSEPDKKKKGPKL